MEQVQNKRLVPFSHEVAGGLTAPANQQFNSVAKQQPEEINSDMDAVHPPSVQILRYPEGVDTEPGQGHYMMFEVMQTDPAKLISRKLSADVIKSAQAINAQHNTTQANIAMADDFGVADATVAAVNNLKANMSAKHSGPNSLQVKTPATANMVALAALYMPPSLTVSYGANYNQEKLGVMAESVNAGLRDFQASGGMANLGHALAVGGSTAAGGAVSGAINWGKEQLATGGEAMLAINAGSIITPRMELMFEGIMRRNFSFDFTFIPKRIEEAQSAEKIVKMFKKHMTSDYGGLGLGGVDGVREMKIPNFFNIKYYYRGKENTHVNKIKQCVLTKLDVAYGADQYKAFETGQPQTTKLTLNFQELEFITKKYVDQGY